MVASRPMRALWLQNQQLEFRDNLPMPLPGAKEALIRVRLAGVCSTDLELLRGYYPFTGIPGHEFVGEVVSCSSDITWEGKRVVGEINIACGECETCRSGLPRHCERRKTLGIHDWDGAFAETLVLPLANLHRIPDQVSDKQAVFTEPLAAAYEILEQTEIAAKDKVLIVGAGRLGQLAAQVLQTTGCKLEVLTRHAKQAELLEKRNIQTVNGSSLTDKKYDVVVEATGSVEGFELARNHIRPRGRIILKSTYIGSLQVNFSAVVVDEITLIGSRCGPFEPALHLLAADLVDPEPLIEAVYPLEKGVAAFTHAAQPGVFKVLVEM